MATGPQPTLFNQAVSRILSSWAALQLAVEHGFGGPDSRQKAQDLVRDIEGLFRSKRKLDAYDFAAYLEDEVDERFDLVLEDGSVQVIADHICQCFSRLKEGHISEVEKFLQGLPSGDRSRVQYNGEDSSSDEDGDDEDMDNPSCQPHHLVQQQQQQQQQESASSQSHCSSNGSGTSTNGAGDAAMDVEEDDGWTVVKKGGRRR